MEVGPSRWTGGAAAVGEGGEKYVMTWGGLACGVLGLALWAITSWGRPMGLAHAGQKAAAGCQGPGAPVVFRSIARGGIGQLREPGTAVIRQEADWQALWGRLALALSPPASAPGVDFSTEMVLAVFAGEGRGVLETEISRVERREGCLLVTVAERRSPQAFPVGQFLPLRPFHLVRLGRGAESVVFRYVRTMHVTAAWTVVWQALEAVVGERGDAVAVADPEQGVLTTAPAPLPLARLKETVRVAPESDWEAGQYWLEMRLEQLEAAAVRVEVGAQIECRGRSPYRPEDAVDWWPCSSTGAIEEEVLRALTPQLAAREHLGP